MYSTHGSKLGRRRAGAVAAPLLAAALLAPVAHAEPPPKDPAMAETLFADGKKRMSAGDFASACPKLAESYRLDPGSGTLAALALCHEQLGKTASAWAEFIQVVTEAQQAGRADREKYARQHVAALEPALSRLTISVAPETARLQDVEVHRDKVVVGPAAWGVASPVDPGEHIVEATAPGKLAWSSRIAVSANGDSKAVVVPALASEAPAAMEPGDKPAPALVPPESDVAVKDAALPAHGGQGQRTTGIVLVVAGAASLGVGTYFGLQALSESHTAKQTCTGTRCTDPGAVQANDTAKSDALTADITLGAGVAALGLGALLYFLAPSDASAASPSARPSAPTGGGGEKSARPWTPPWQVLPAVGLRSGGVSVRAAW